MSHVKAAGAARNLTDSPGQRLGVKLFGGQKVKTGQVIVRQVGLTKVCGEGTFLSRNFTIHASRDGIVTFKRVKIRNYTGKSTFRTQVSVAVPDSAKSEK
jgi:large subunit ribosomal protein L27